MYILQPRTGNTVLFILRIQIHDLAKQVSLSFISVEVNYQVLINQGIPMEFVGQIYIRYFKVLLPTLYTKETMISGCLPCRIKWGHIWHNTKSKNIYGRDCKLLPLQTYEHTHLSIVVMHNIVSSWRTCSSNKSEFYLLKVIL